MCLKKVDKQLNILHYGLHGERMKVFSVTQSHMMEN